jgi:aquaporin Z
MRNYVTEFIGTFILCLTVGMTAVNQVPLAPLAIGSALMIMVYMGGHISGGHFNPAVSLSVALRGKLAWGQFGGYVASQLLGAAAATLATQFMLGDTPSAAPSPDASIAAVLVNEVLWTFALCLVVLNVAVSAKTKGNSYYGLAIGFTVVVAAFAGETPGGTVNPAVSTGITLVHGLLTGESMSSVWLFLVGPFAGSALAAVVFGVQEAE